ncbi:MAG: YceI family protein [Armatimonadetes bacterium]|nr:YceI family protein [Armatimonadota bacterium]
MRRLLFLVPALAAVLFALGLVRNNSTSFSLKDPKSVNSIRFTLDGRIEQFSGMTSGIAGDFTFDPEDVAATRGKVVVQAASLATNVANMTEYMRGTLWLDTDKYPTIEFEIKKIEGVRPVEAKDRTWTMSVTGDFTLHGVTKSITIPVRLTHLPGELKQRNRGAGDLIVLRSKFKIKRSDYGVKGNQPFDVVSDIVEIEFSIGAFARAPTE